MATKRLAWDACTWIALIQQERIGDANGRIIEDRYAMCKEVILAAEVGQCEIVTSALCYAEVCKNNDLRGKDEDKIAAFFENDYVLPVSLDRTVGEKARTIMMSGVAKLKPPDACHLATALIANATNSIRSTIEFFRWTENWTSRTERSSKYANPIQAVRRLPC